MGNAYGYNDRLSDIRSILNGMEKTAADDHIENTKADVLDTDIRKKVGPGVTADKSKETNEGIAGSKNPLDADDNDAVGYLLDADKKTQDVNAVKTAEAQLLQGIYGALYSKQAEEEEEDEEDEEDEEEMEDAPDEESAEEVALTPEEEEALKGKPKTEKKAYIMTKRAGYAYAKELMESGTLEKIATQVYAPQIESIGDLKAGQVFARLEKAGMFPSQAQVNETATVLAGQQIAQMEKAGMVPNQAQVNETAMVLAGRQIAQMEKAGMLVITDPSIKDTSFEKSAAENTVIVKQAAEKATNQVLNDLYKLNRGKDINKKLTKIANPS